MIAAIVGAIALEASGDAALQPQLTVTTNHTEPAGGIFMTTDLITASTPGPVIVTIRARTARVLVVADPDCRAATIAISAVETDNVTLAALHGTDVIERGALISIEVPRLSHDLTPLRGRRTAVFRRNDELALPASAGALSPAGGGASASAGGRRGVDEPTVRIDLRVPAGSATEVVLEAGEVTMRGPMTDALVTPGPIADLTKVTPSGRPRRRTF